MAAAFATYLGPYSFAFRREMLTEHWPRCLDERGVMLVVDGSTPYAGAEVFSSAKTTQDEEEVSAQLDKNANEDNNKEEQNGKIRAFFFALPLKK